MTARPPNGPGLGMTILICLPAVIWFGVTGFVALHFILKFW